MNIPKARLQNSALVNRIALPLMLGRALPTLAIHFDLIEIAHQDETAHDHRQLVIAIIQVRGVLSPYFRIHKLTTFVTLQAIDVDLEPHHTGETELRLETQ